MDIEITLDDIIEYLGQPRTKIGREYIWKCPYCVDHSADNMHYNPDKNILWCFSNPEHNKLILSEIMKKKHEREKMNRPIERPRYLDLQEQYLYYMELCNMMLLGKLNERWLQGMVNQNMYSLDEYKELIQIAQSDKPQKAREYLRQKRGINTSTIELTGLGFDFIDKKWVIPIFTEKYIVGFEYRGADFDKKQVKKEPGTPTCLAHIYGAINSKNVIIVEGLLDGIVLSSMVKDTLIVSCSNGVQGTLKCLSELQFNKYDKIKLILDNDNAGNEETKKIIEKYPFIIDSRKFLVDNDVKDITDWVLLKGVNNDN